jgi:hypothetical protein
MRQQGSLCHGTDGDPLPPVQQIADDLGVSKRSIVSLTAEPDEVYIFPPIFLISALTRERTRSGTDFCLCCIRIANFTDNQDRTDHQSVPLFLMSRSYRSGDSLKRFE